MGSISGRNGVGSERFAAEWWEKCENSSQNACLFAQWCEKLSFRASVAKVLSRSIVKRMLFGGFVQIGALGASWGFPGLPPGDPWSLLGLPGLLGLPWGFLGLLGAFGGQWSKMLETGFLGASWGRLAAKDFKLLEMGLLGASGGVWRPREAGLLNRSFSCCSVASNQTFPGLPALRVHAALASG